MFFFFSSIRRHTRCALVTGVQTCALPISAVTMPRWSLERRRTGAERRVITTPPNCTQLDSCRGPPSPLLHGIELGEITGNKETAVPRGNDFHSINGSRALSPRASRPPAPQSGHSLSRRGSTKRDRKRVG